MNVRLEGTLSTSCHHSEAALRSIESRAVAE